MIKKISVRSFKTISNLEIELGLVNVFIGANGSGKSNLLEAIGLLSAAASGKVNNETLTYRGVRPGLPDHFKTAFRGRRPVHIFLSASDGDTSSYQVSLFNPIKKAKSDWTYHTETWDSNGGHIVGRSNRNKKENAYNPELGVAALKMVELKPEIPAFEFLKTLQDYAIFEPNTNALRKVATEQVGRSPLALDGSGLAGAISRLNSILKNSDEPWLKMHLTSFLKLIDWAQQVTFSVRTGDLVSNTDRPTRLSFKDRFMSPDARPVSSADASEGALYVLFAAVLALDQTGSRLVAIDNADHGLNPRLARALMRTFSDAILQSPVPRQVLLTTHNPLALDGLPLEDDRVRLFTVGRSDQGATLVKRVEMTPRLREQMNRDRAALSRLWVMGSFGGVPNV